MKTNEALRSIMKLEGIGLTDLAKRLGKTPRLVSDRLRLDNISIDKLNELTSVLGYTVALVPNDAQLSENVFILE